MQTFSILTSNRIKIPFFNIRFAIDKNCFFCQEYNLKQAILDFKLGNYIMGQECIKNFYLKNRFIDKRFSVLASKSKGVIRKAFFLKIINFKDLFLYKCSILIKKSSLTKFFFPKMILKSESWVHSPNYTRKKN